MSKTKTWEEGSEGCLCGAKTTPEQYADRLADAVGAFLSRLWHRLVSFIYVRKKLAGLWLAQRMFTVVILTATLSAFVTAGALYATTHAWVERKIERQITAAIASQSGKRVGGFLMLKNRSGETVVTPSEQMYLFMDDPEIKEHNRKLMGLKAKK